MPDRDTREVPPQVRNDQELRALYQERNARSSFRTPTTHLAPRRGWYLQLFLLVVVAASVSLLTALSVFNAVPLSLFLPFERTLRPAQPALELSEDLQHRLASSVVAMLPAKAGSGSTGQPYLVQDSVGQGLALSSDGWLVTTQGVVAQTGRTYQVASGSGHLYPSELLLVDPVAPLTFIKTSAVGLTATPFADAVSLVVNQPVAVAVLGTQSADPAFYLRHLAHLSAHLVRSSAEVPVSSETLPDRYLLDSPLPPGSQGAPVTTLRGDVIGLVADYGGELRAVVPLDSLGSVIDRLFADHEVHRSALGITYVQSAWLAPFVTSGVPTDGALVTAVRTPAPKTAAPGGGLQVGDRIVAVAGERVAERSLSSLLQQYRPGTRLNLSVNRGGNELTVTVTLGELVGKQAASAKPTS